MHINPLGLQGMSFVRLELDQHFNALSFDIINHLLGSESTTPSLAPQQVISPVMQTSKEI